MWPFKTTPEPVRINTTEDLLRDLKLLQKRYDVPLIVQQKWRYVVSNADLGTAPALLGAVLSILETQVASK